jgi:hypothetical protein
MVGPTLDYIGESPRMSTIIDAHNPGLQRKPSRRKTGSCVLVTLVVLADFLTFENQVRIYQVKKEDLLGRDLKSANAFAKGKKRKRSKPLLKRKAKV